MAESTGWGGEFHAHNGTALQELLNVIECGLPQDERDWLETTTLKATGKRKTFIAGMIDGGEFNVMMNYVPNSADDQLCRELQSLTTPRAIKIGIPDDDGTALRKFETEALFTYKIAPMKPNEVMTCTLTVKVSGDVTEAAY